MDYKPLRCPYKEVYCNHRPYFGISNGNYKSPALGVSIDDLNKFGINNAPCPKWRGNHCKDEE